MTTESTIKLPSHPSDLIDIALQDLEKVERMKDVYIVDMSEYHHYSKHHNKCLVCLAGSVMSQTLKLPKNQTFVPFNLINLDTEHKLLALNDLRMGCIGSAFRLLGIKIQHTLSTDVVYYNKNKSLFKKQMKAIALTLKELSETAEGLINIRQEDFDYRYNSNLSKL